MWKCRLDFTVLEEYEMKMKGSEKYLALVRELTKLWKMKVTVILIVGTLETVRKGKGDWKNWRSDEEPWPYGVPHC